LTREQAGAIGVLRAFLGRRGALTSLNIWITPCSSWALALVRASIVEAACPRSTGILGTFINILAAMDGISGVACLTMTLWWISWGAVSVYATHEPFARTLTLSSIFGVGEEGRRADALARFDTLLVRTTVVVSRALGLVCGTHTRVWITSGSDRTDAAIRTNFILAECSKPTSSGGGQAFVNVCASSIRVDVESSRASTIADSSGDGDALCTLGAVTLVLASCKHTLASILGVRGLAAAVWSIAGGTLHKRIPIETRRAFTVKAAWKVLAESICSTRRVFA